ncbi:hypothetical protein [Streptomyces sp. NPDC005805]|uniref:hypothetical protein n=1 Tax=Streptomyces sp. NPDC005805 TaxID=3157068 RepID=UPI00340D89F6
MRRDEEPGRDREPDRDEGPGGEPGGARAEGAGPFTTRLTWRSAEGGTAVWESRAVRKLGALTVRAAHEAEAVLRPADRRTLARLRLLNALAAITFTAGGALFAAGASLAIAAPGEVIATTVTYFTGGMFFNTGGYVSLLQTLNAPRRSADGDRLEPVPWRWWSYEPMRIDWLGTFLLFVGTLVFGVNLLDSFLQGLTTQQAARLVWAPDVIGCVLFLISGQLALAEVCHGRSGIRVHDLGWWIVAVNLAGSALFMLAAVADLVTPGSESTVSLAVANWGTLAGALCFAGAGVLQGFEHP